MAASKSALSLYLADQDLSISPQGVAKWKDLDQQERDWVCSLIEVCIMIIILYVVSLKVAS